LDGFSWREPVSTSLENALTANAFLSGGRLRGRVLRATMAALATAHFRAVIL
jgi:hypothetical protein